MADTLLAAVAEPKRYADWSPPAVSITRHEEDGEVTIMATPLLADRRMIDSASVRVRIDEPSLVDWMARLIAVLPAIQRDALNARVFDLTYVNPKD